MAEDFVTKKHFDESMKYLDEKFDILLGAISDGFQENKIEHDRLEEKIDTVGNNLDGYIKSYENQKIEFTVLKRRVDVVEAKVGIGK